MSSPPDAQEYGLGVITPNHPKTCSREQFSSGSVVAAFSLERRHACRSSLSLLPRSLFDPRSFPRARSLSGYLTTSLSP